VAARRKIVVIEDDESMRRGIQRLLDAAGFESVGYASGEALLAGGDQNAACVVCDLRLPGISGLDLLAELRAQGRRSPFLLITAHDSSRVREEAVRRGAAYLAKPFVGEALLEAVNSSIEPATPS